MPKGPSAQDLYGGPRAFSGHQTEQAQAAQPYLSTLNQISRTGFTPTDRGAFAQQQQQANQGEQAQRGAIEQNAAARGQLGGGLQFAQALAAQQGGANRAQEAGTQMAVAGADRRMAATQAGANLAGQAGAANDAFNQFATGAQAGAAQGAYQNQMAGYQQKKANQQQWWDRLSGLAGNLL
jgi:hypothetical protein